MVNVIFNDFSYEVLPRQLETWDKYCKIIQWGRANPTRFLEDFIGMQFTDHQKYVLLSSWLPANVVWVCSRSTGKATLLDTEVYSVTSDRGSDSDKFPRKTIGDLKIGDTIFDADGKPTKVIHLNPIVFDEVYEVEFEDGEVIGCNADHLWTVNDRDYNIRNPDLNRFVVRNTDFLYTHFADRFSEKGKDYRFHVPLTKPVEYADYGHFPIDPYLLGVWLGDGDSYAPRITSEGKDVFEMNEKLKEYSTVTLLKKQKNKNNCYSIFIDREKELKENGYTRKTSLTKKLRDLNLLGNKHIPDRYMFASVEKRLALLQGLMDTDGTIGTKGTCEFTQSKKELAEQVCHLIRSLGMDATLTHKEHTNYIKKDGIEADTWRVYFTASKEMPVFRLQRKLDRLPEHPIRGSDRKAIVDVRKTGVKKAMRCITVNNESGCYLTGKNFTVTHNSFMSAPLIMARSLLIPSHNTYIMGPTGSQAQETFSKMENLAKNNIASVIGVSSVFLDETVRINSKADPFVHDKNSYHVELYNGSTVNTLNSVAKNIVGIRSNFNVYDEAGKIERDFYALTLPFTVQNADFRMGGTLNSDLYPRQLQNKNLLCSSAEGIDSELFDRYKIAFNRMLMGDPEYFVCDLDCSHSLHPFLNGKPAPPLLTQDTIDDAFKTNPYRATREYFNKFDNDGGEDVFVKRSVLNKHSIPMNPVFRNDGTKKYIIAYDPSSKIDNSVVMIAELFEDEERGYMCKFVHCLNLIEVLKNGEKVLIQKPEQIERLKDIILDYNRGALDYDNIDMLIIDAGAGGGGTDIAQFLMNEWIGKDRKMHLGFIDKTDPYMSLREDDYPANRDNLRMFNFKRDKVQAYERAQNAINQGLAIFPISLNARNEIEFEDVSADGSVRIRYEKADGDELASLVQMDLAKEELVAMQKIKKPNGTIQFDLSPDAKSRNFHDDRADCVAMILDRLMEIRANEALVKEAPKEDFKKVFSSRPMQKKSNPFGSGPNPFFKGRNVI